MKKDKIKVGDFVYLKKDKNRKPYFIHQIKNGNVVLIPNKIKANINEIKQFNKKIIKELELKLPLKEDEKKDFQKRLKIKNKNDNRKRFSIM